MRPLFALSLLASAVSAWNGAPLAWDGAYFLFKILDLRQPFAPPNRPIHEILQAPVLVAIGRTDDLAVLRAVFAASYTLVPVLGLAASWWVVRSRPGLFVWPALSIALFALPGQLFYVSEGPIAVALFWPIVLALAAGSPLRVLPLLALLAAGVWTAHPIAVVLFAAAAALALYVGVHDPRRRRLAWAMAGVAGILSLTRALQPLSGYETESLTTQRLVDSFQVAIRGWPLVALVFAGLAAMLTFALPYVLPRTTGRFERSLRLAPSILAGAAGLSLIPWARNPYVWAHALDFRFWAGPLALALMLVACVEAVRASATPGEARVAASRRWLATTVAATALLVVAVQSRSWAQETDVLRRALAQAPDPCVATSSLPWLAGSPMNHWATASLAILLQDRSPHSLALDGDGCAQYRASGVFPLAPWDPRPAGTGWFNLPVLSPARPSG